MLVRGRGGGFSIGTKAAECTRLLVFTLSVCYVKISIILEGAFKFIMHVCQSNSYTSSYEWINAAIWYMNTLL